MNEQEKSMITELADRIRSTPPPQKDLDAEKLINEHIASQKNAPYIMTQTMLVQQQAIASLQQRIQNLEHQQLHTTKGKKGFLGNLFGNKQPKSPYPGQAPQSSRYAPQQMPPSSGGGSSFLGSAMSTAVGVAGGMALFSGLEHLFGGGHASAAADVANMAQDTTSFLGDGDLLSDGLGAPGALEETATNFSDAGSDMDFGDFGDGGFGDW